MKNNSIGKYPEGRSMSTAPISGGVMSLYTFGADRCPLLTAGLRVCKTDGSHCKVGEELYCAHFRDIVESHNRAYGLTRWLWLVRHRESFIMGKNVEIGSFTVIGCEHGVTIEDNVKIGYHCTIMSDSTIDNKHGPVVLSRGCGIGAGSIIMPNVTVGEGAIVGANSFVNQDIPAGQTWAGTPARRIDWPREVE